MDRQIIQSALRPQVLWANALAAVGTGALLGALVAMPYNQLIGLSDTACTVMRSLVAAGVLVGLSARRTALTWELEETCSAGEEG